MAKSGYTVVFCFPSYKIKQVANKMQVGEVEN